MYSLINQHVEPLLDGLSKGTPSTPPHFEEYCWLFERLQQGDVTTDTDFQRRYKAFWSMNVARLDKSYLAEHFRFLEQHKLERPAPSVEAVARHLYAFPTGTDGRKTLQFSFASKLVHMISPAMPVYDRMVEHFYFLPNGSETGLDRLGKLMKSYDFLVGEHRRIIGANLLQEGIDACRRRFPNANLTNEKIIDSLIWSFVSKLQSGWVRDGQVAYSS